MQLVTVSVQTVDPLALPKSQLDSMTSAQLATVYGDVNNTYSQLCRQLEQSTDPKAKAALQTLMNTPIPYEVSCYEPTTKYITVPLKNFAPPPCTSPSMSTIKRESMANVINIMNNAINTAKLALTFSGGLPL